MEVNPEFLFSWILFHLVSWEMDEKFSFWPNTHTHTHTHTPHYTKPALLKAGGSWEKVTYSTYVRWQSIPQRMFLSLNILLAILCPPSPSRRHLTTLSSCLTRPPVPVPNPSTSWTVLWIPPLNSSCGSAEWFHPPGPAPTCMEVPDIHNSITGTQTHSLLTMGLHISLSHHTVHIFPKFGCF